MSGISSKALNFGNPENKYKFNGIEQNNDFDLNMYDAYYRNLDPQVGRFWQIDPQTEALESYSPFESMGNNPISNVDPLGDFKGRFGAWLHSIWNGGDVGQNIYGEWYVSKTSSSSSEDGSVTVKAEVSYGKGRSATTAAGEYYREQEEMRMDIEIRGERSIYKEYNSQREASEASLQMGVQVLLPNVIKGVTGALNVEKASERVNAPKGWIKEVSKKSGGTVFKDPKNPHNIIREMPGNPKSPNPAQQNPYVKFMKDGKFYDVNGKPLPNGSVPDAHIPLTQFNINKMPKF